MLLICCGEFDRLFSKLFSEVVVAKSQFNSQPPVNCVHLSRIMGVNMLSEVAEVGLAIPL